MKPSTVPPVIQKTLRQWKWMGEGSHGTVWTARWKSHKNQFVAVKAYEQSLQNGGLIVECVRELSMLRTLNHSNIVARLGVYHEEGHIFLIMEGMQRNLREQTHVDMYDAKLSAEQHETRRRVYLTQVLDAMVYLHERNIMHRDIKPDNVLVNDRMLVKLADFGHARRYSSFERSYTVDVCTPPYRAIELWQKKKDYVIDIDLWSYGCMAFEVYTNKFLFDDETEKSIDDLVLKMRRCMDPSFEWEMDTFFFHTIVSHTIRESPRTSAQELKDLLCKLLC